MTLDLPQPIADVLQPMFDALPLAHAMPALVGASDAHMHLVGDVINAPAIAAKPTLQAGLWLYADQLNRSHDVSQTIETPTGSYWHAIMHRREGDYGNSHYWFRRVGKHPAMRALADYDADAFVDAVAQTRDPRDPALVDLQRREWAALFSWCALQ